MTRRVAASMQDLSKVIGDDGVERLAAAAGGTRVYIPAPRNLHAEHWLVRLLGLDAAHALSAHFVVYLNGGHRGGSGGTIDVPVMPLIKKKEILAATGTNRDVALNLRCTERYVSRVRAMAGGRVPCRPGRKRRGRQA